MWETLNLKAERWPDRTPLIEHSGLTGEYVSHFSHFGSLCLQSSPWNCGSRPLPMMNCATVEREVGQIDHSVRCPLWCLGLHQEGSEEGGVRKFSGAKVAADIRSLSVNPQYDVSLLRRQRWKCSQRSRELIQLQWLQVVTILYFGPGAVLPLLNQRACYLRCSAAIWDKHYLAQLWFCSDKAGLIKLDLIGIAFKHSAQPEQILWFQSSPWERLEEEREAMS